MAFAPGMTSPSMDVVRKILSFQTIGDEWPRPGSAVFHTMFLFTPHSSGRFFSSETPRLCGPRHCGQFEAPSRDCARVLKPQKMLMADSSAQVKCVLFIFVQFVLGFKKVDCDPQYLRRLN